MKRIRARSKRQKIIAMLACGCERGEIINALDVTPGFVRKVICDLKKVRNQARLSSSPAEKQAEVSIAPEALREGGE